MGGKKRYLLIIFLILFCLSFYTIAYSAINSTARVSGKAYARVEADARITDFRLASTNNATSSYEEFGKNHVVTEIDLLNSSSQITYYIEITNYGSTDVGIYSISGLPSGVNYSIKDYNLKDKICDENNVCNGFIKKTFKITLTTTGTYAGNIQLNFEFRPFFNINYVGFSNQYLNEFIAGDSVSIDLSKDSPSFIYASGQEEFKYTYNSNVLSFNDAWCDIEVGIIDTTNFSYTGDVQIYNVKADGVYKVELWGAQGTGKGGNSGYTSGYAKMNKDDTYYIHVGSQTDIADDYTIGGYNGGGYGTIYGEATGGYSYAGGGASDIRLKSGVWNNFDGLKSRVMIAAGGAGEQYKPNYLTGAIPGYGGGLIGGRSSGDVYTAGKQFLQPYGATQTRGGIGDDSSYDGLFGMGLQYSIDNCWGSGGGGGYYGGAYGCGAAGSGGSSFISWHTGCDAITEGSTSTNIVHTGQSLHYSNYGFSNTVMIDGKGYKWTDEVGSAIVGMPNHDGNGTMIGNTGDGFAKISPVAIGDYHLVKFTNIEEDLSNYSYVADGEDLTINFSNAYDGVTVKNKDGSFNSNYAWNGLDNRIVVNDVSNDIEVIAYTLPKVSFDNYVIDDTSLTQKLVISDFESVSYPFTVEFYIKDASLNTNYSLEETITLTNETTYYYTYTGLDMGGSYEMMVKVIDRFGNSVSTRAYGGTSCFVAGTKVLTDNGLVNIEDIEIGDFVYAINTDTNEKELKEVIDLYEGYTNETYELYVDDQIIITTPKHQFYVIDKGWVRAYALQEGDVLNGFTNGNKVINKIVNKKHEELVSVYNITVEGYHNYLVTEYQLLVHNVGSK